MHYAFLIVLSWSPADQFSLSPHSAHAYYTALEQLAIYISKPSVLLAVCASRPASGAAGVVIVGDHDSSSELS
jgi:hypothetical protein